MTRTLTCLALLLTSSYVFSQDSAQVKFLDEVVITSNKYQRKQTETGKVLTVIGREQLERSAGKTLGEVLNTVAGTTIIGANSNLGTNQTSSIRGSTAGNVLILIDGLPVNDPSVVTNYFDLNFFSIDQIERVEILKGGQSTLYGSDAVAGVINVITKKPSAPGTHGDVLLSAGSYGTLKTNLGVSRSTKRSALSLQYGYLKSRGFSSSFDSTGKAGFDDDKYDQHSVAGNWQMRITERLRANVSGRYSRYTTGVDLAAFTDEKDYTVTTDNLQGGAGLSYAMNNGGLQFNYRYNTINRLYLNDSLYGAPDYSRFDYDGHTHFVEVYGNKKWKNIELLAGIDYRKNGMSTRTISVSSFGPYESALDDSIGKMAQISPYASVVLKANKVFNIELGGRYNHHSEYGDNVTYTINPSVFLAKKIKLFTNLYSAFKTPTLFQLFEPFIGNSELKPEESFNIETGAQWFVTPEFNARAVYFYRSTRDAIEFIYTDPTNYLSQYANVSLKRANGVEIEAEYRGARWNASANYTHTYGRLRSRYDATGFPVKADTTMTYIYRNPANVMNVTGGVWAMKNLYVGTVLRVAGKRLEPVYGAAPVELDSYYTLDLYGEYGFGKKLKVFADFKNITSQEYFEILGYSTRRFNFMAGVKLGW